MTITWLGHAAFLLETRTEAGHVRLITDPYASVIGYDPINQDAGIVTLSHENPKYHSYLGDIGGEPTIVRGLEILGQPIAVRGLHIGAVAVWEEFDAQSGTGEGPNAMMWIESEGLRVLHMGDVGHRLNDDQIAACGRVDVLLAAAGGPPTIELGHLQAFIDRLQPRLVIPMHFGTAKIDLKIQPISDLAALFPPDQVVYESSPTLTLSRDALDKLQPAPLLCVLQHAR